MVAMRDGVELGDRPWTPSVTPAPTLLVPAADGKDLPQLLAYGLVPTCSPWSKGGSRRGVPGLPRHLAVRRGASRRC